MVSRWNNRRLWWDDRSASICRPAASLTPSRSFALEAALHPGTSKNLLSAGSKVRKSLIAPIGIHRNDPFDQFSHAFISKLTSASHFWQVWQRSKLVFQLFSCAVSLLTHVCSWKSLRETFKIISKATWKEIMLIRFFFAPGNQAFPRLI